MKSAGCAIAIDYLVQFFATSEDDNDDNILKGIKWDLFCLQVVLLASCHLLLAEYNRKMRTNMS